MKIHIIITLCLLLNKYSFSQNFPYKFNRAHMSSGGQGWCEAAVNVGDNRPTDCIFGGNYYMYNVFTEEFNSKEELPNNFRFTTSWNQIDDNYGGGTGITFLGNAYNNNNVSTNNGIGYLTMKKETITGPNNVTYNYTNAFLESYFQMRQGVVEARILLPDYPIGWPAFWLFSNQEIDIFEFNDGDIHSSTNNMSWLDCGSYHHMNMNIHTYIDGNGSTNYSTQNPLMTHCNRNIKFGVPQNHFQSWHDYKCVWTDYEVQIYLDGTLVSYASRYYDGPFTPSGFCHTAALGGDIATRDKDCNYMNSAVDCSVGMNVPNFPDFWNSHWECFKKNRVFKDMSFVQTSIPMNIIIGNSFSYLFGSDSKKVAQLNTLNNAWSGLTDDQKRIGIDWIKVYQPVVCSAPRTLCSLADFKSITGNTNFLSGSVIDIAQGCSFTNHASDEFPMHILYNDNFNVNNTDFSVESGAYCKIEYIDCANGFNTFQRTSSTGKKLFLTHDEIELLEKHSSIIANKTQNITGVSATDNGAIILYPIPTDKILHINLPDEDLYDLFEIEFIDNIGRSYNAPKSKEIDVSFLSPGFYQVKFKFTSGFIVVKNFIKN
jgi:hypothetical protein